jgi:hypothetical protein
VLIVSADSMVAGSTATVLGGLQTNLGSDLQISPSVFLDADSLLQPSCADRGAARSSFTRSGRGGLPPAPDRPLPSADAANPAPSVSSGAGSLLVEACGPVADPAS